MADNLCLYPVAPPFDIVYRNGISEYPVGPHTHNAAELYLTLTDLPDVLLNDTISEVPAGTLLIIPAFCVHQLYHETQTVYERYILSINTEWLKSAMCAGFGSFGYLEDSHNPITLSVGDKERGALIRCFRRLLENEDRENPVYFSDFFSTMGLLSTVAEELTAGNVTRLPVSPSQERVNEMIVYIREHIGSGVNVGELSDHFHLNPDYLSRLFKKHMHISVGRYITLQKISMAEELLRAGKTVSEVQEELGFSSYAFFFKTFQRYTGISPSRYRSSEVYL